MIMTEALHSKRFPNETDAYRDSRNQLLEAEVSLRRQLETVAAMRRTLPLGGEIPEDYAFTEGARDLNNSETRVTTHLSELFAPGQDALIIYSFMYGPEMKSPCTSCTSILDGLNGMVFHATDRMNVVVVAKNPIEQIRTFARRRGWNNLRLLSSADNTYNRDYFGEVNEGGTGRTGDDSPAPNQMPSLNVFVRRQGRIYHTYHTELLFAPNEPGQDGRHVDLIWPLWNLFDYTPEGRGEKWYPRLSYQPEFHSLK
jgi:predicted dithiol-disulfide oxidoreductase (DUF899 family)